MLQRLLSLLLICASIFCCTPLIAKHIIGGVITYECLGDGNYRFTLKMYRDCSDPTGAQFDNPAIIGVYRGDNQDEEDVLFIPLDVDTDIEPNIEDPCLVIPPNVCVEEGIYVWEYQIPNWPDSEPWHFSYQRCCRNNSIDNIVLPGETGATFTIEVTPEAQNADCSGTPVFNDFPPIVICAGEELEFDHSATDPDGDLLIYELCSPLKGGGVDGINGNPPTPTPCDDVVPNPACPPPYEPVDFALPTYNALNPLGGDPPVTIDASTGLLHGTPIVQGQFVVGVCVNEFRNGELLSIVRRDFQFNVTPCEPLVEADIVADSIFENIDFYIFSCDETTFQLENESSELQNVDTYYWEFYINGDTITYNEWEPEVTMPGPGNYDGLLALNPGEECGDTAFVHINIYPSLVADFSYEYDTCIAGPVFFSDLSTVDGSTIETYNWTFGNGEADSIASPFVQYEEPNTYPVGLEITDANGCEADTALLVTYFPVPGLIVVSPDDEVSCPPAEITFRNLSNPIDTSYQINWDFGDGEFTQALSPTHVYQDTGLYTVALEIISPIGCITDTVFHDLILVQDPPQAEFSYTPDVFTNFEPNISLTDESYRAIHWDWYVNDGYISSDQHPNYVFPDTGLQEITLIVNSPEDCQDTISHIVDVVPKVTYFLPNAFTPNEDTVNDLFGGKGFLRGVSNFRFMIWNRYGELIYQTDDPTSYWNGRYQNSGQLSPMGVYVVQVKFTGPRGEPFEFEGFATLIK